MEQIKGAGIILTDDLAELFFFYESAYPVLSHNLERDARADLISFRWQQYTRNHDKLPLAVVAGNDIPLATSAQTLRQLEAYLHTPIFRIALIEGFAHYTSDWQYQALGGDPMAGLDADSLVNTIATWIEALPDPPSRKPLRDGSRLTMTDLAHFCSHMVNGAAIDQIVASFDRFCISGEMSSLPYLHRKLDALGKPYIRVPSHSPNILRPLLQDFDCLLICGSVGRVEPRVPAVALQHADVPWRCQNIGALADTLPPIWSVPASGVDWYHSFALGRTADYGDWQSARKHESDKRAKQFAKISRCSCIFNFKCARRPATWCVRRKTDHAKTVGKHGFPQRPKCLISTRDEVDSPEIGLAALIHGHGSDSLAGVA
jgi:hypothetical protein